jgi:hypothetical protein
MFNPRPFLSLILAKSMVVNVNPFDTGIDENFRVMEFSSLARDVRLKTTVSAFAQRRRTFKISLAGLAGIAEARETMVEVVEGKAKIQFNENVHS